MRASVQWRRSVRAAVFFRSGEGARFALKGVVLTSNPATDQSKRGTFPAPALEAEALSTMSTTHLTATQQLGNGAFQFGFTNMPGSSFTVLATTNVGFPLSNWFVPGAPMEISAGQFQFTDLQATNRSKSFYRVRSP
jgi:hypothetical protein